MRAELKRVEKRKVKIIQWKIESINILIDVETAIYFIKNKRKKIKIKLDVSNETKVERKLTKTKNYENMIQKVQPNVYVILAKCLK